MDRSEKEELIGKVTDLAERDVLQREDMIGIMKICREACDRRIGELEERTKPAEQVQ